MSSDVKMYGPVAVRKIVRDFGYPPSVIRSAITSMRRRGIGYKKTIQAIGTVNSANAHENFQLAQESADFESVKREIELKIELATTFIAQQRERDPAKRTRLWNECLRLVVELENLNGETTTSTT